MGEETKEFPCLECYLDENYDVKPLKNKNIQGEKVLTCYVKKAKKDKSFTKLFGKWNRRFLTVSLTEMDFYYKNKPTSKSKTYLPLDVKLYCEY